MLGGLGQELSGVSRVFQEKIEACLNIIVGRIAACMEEAQASGYLPPDADPHHMANLIVNCWEGAALRIRLRTQGLTSLVADLSAIQPEARRAA